MTASPLFTNQATNDVMRSRSKEPQPYVLSHHYLDLVLDLGADVSRDVAGQLVGGRLEAVNHLLELTNHGVAGLQLPLLPALHVSLQLLDVCKDQEQVVNI